MNTQHALLQGILDSRADNLPRLVYADWLEENCVNDVDVATVEFIRVSCGKPREQTILWLKDNWHRLAPTFLKRWCRRDMFPNDYGMHAKHMRASMVVWYGVDRQYRQARTWLYFDRGFVAKVFSPSYHVMNKVPASITKDQPLLNLLNMPTTAKPQLARDRRLYQTQIDELVKEACA